MPLPKNFNELCLPSKIYLGMSGFLFAVSLLINIAALLMSRKGKKGPKIDFGSRFIYLVIHLIGILFFLNILRQW